MNISNALIARPIATSLLMAGILLIVAAAYPLLPLAPLPQVDFPTIQVTAQLPGASPEIMASSVTQPLERQFGQIPGVSQMTSSSVLGNSAITVQFDLARNIDGAAQERLHCAETGQVDRHIPPRRSGDRDRDCRRERGCCRRSNVGCRMMLSPDIAAPYGRQDCYADKQVPAPPVDLK